MSITCYFKATYSITLNCNIKKTFSPNTVISIYISPNIQTIKENRLEYKLISGIYIEYD